MDANFILSTGSSLGICNPPTIEAKDERPPGIGTFQPTNMTTKKVNNLKV